MSKIQINDLTFGQGESVFVIAEAGVNHNGSFSMAKELVDAAVEARADAVKFQTFKAENLATATAAKAKYQINRSDSQTQREMLKKLELSDENFVELKKYCDKKKIIFMSTAHDDASIDFLDKLNVPLFKVASPDVTNIPYLKQLAQKKRPIILSTGMATIGEIEEALCAIYSEQNRDIILLQCTSSYPVHDEDCNLAAMKTLEAAFQVPVGFSDHTLGTAISLAAVAQGAVVLEKHFTLDTKLPGPDHKMSLEPAQLKQLIQDIRRIEKALGDGIKRPTPDELETAAVARKSLVAARNISKGTKISQNMIAVKRPGTGIKPKHLAGIIGMRAAADIQADSLIEWWMLCD